MRVLITGSHFRDNLATMNALNEVPHAGVEIVVTEFGVEVEVKDGDRWVLVNPPIVFSGDDWIPDSYWAFNTMQLPTSWLKLLVHCGLSGTTCQIEKGMKVIQEETAQ